MTKRMKYGYLSYADMMTKIQDGILDVHDIVFAKDTKECFIITPELTPSPVVSRVRIFNSVSEANELLNTYSDTYAGQIVSIIVKGTHKGYIVNESDGVFQAVPLGLADGEIDYNTIGNRPIINVVGEIGSPIVLSELKNGIYAVTGQYKIAPEDATIYSVSTAVICIVDHADNGSTHIKKVQSSGIKDYEIVDDVVTAINYITERDLVEYGYATRAYVEEKLAEVNFVTAENVDTIVDEKVAEVVSTTVESMIDAKIDEKMQEASEEDITALFK